MPKLRRSERFSKFISQNPICVVQKVLLQVHEKRFVRSLVWSNEVGVAGAFCLDGTFGTMSGEHSCVLREDEEFA